MLVDILAALPMEHVLRKARLGHDNLRRGCSLKWVTDRMTDVHFRAVVKAHQVGGDVAAAFSSYSVKKRLKGKIVMSRHIFETTGLMDAYVNILKEVPGKIVVCAEGFDYNNFETVNQADMSARALSSLTNLTYFSTTFDGASLSMILYCPWLVFVYKRVIGQHSHFVVYRPALLNGRHIVDVVSAVCGPADVSEAELERARREATKAAGEDEWSEVWSTNWRTAAVNPKASEQFFM